MNEEAKTGVYWAVAAAMAALAAFVAWPTKIETEESQQIGKVLFENFTDPLAAASMKIVTFDADQSAISDFEVAKDGDGVWRIPTHGGYTADAESQMKKAATLFLDNTILDVSTTNREDHAGFGVLDPTSNDVKVGSQGVGRLVSIKDSKGTTMVSLIVGNEVEGQPGQRYVRRPGQDIVYAVDLDDAALTTKFTDWIEQDLLQLTPFDVAGVTLKNYTASIDMLNNSVQEERDFDADLTIDGSEWKLARLDTYKQGTSVPRPLGEKEKLNTQKLNELKRALDDLKIADVGRKPEGMSANLKASKDMLSDQTALRSLVARGFIPAGRAGSDETEILAANGEIAVRLKDGVRYILRFGNVAGLSEQEQEAAESEEVGMVGSNRYMLVTTEVDESIIPMPQLQPVPQTIEELDAPAQAPESPEAETADTEAPDAAAQPPEMTDVPAPPAESNLPAEEAPAENEPPAAEDAPAEKEAAPAEETPETEETPDSEEGPSLGDPAGDEPATETDAEAAVEEAGETTQEESVEGTATGEGQDAEAAQEGAADEDGEAAQDGDATEDADEPQTAPAEEPAAAADGKDEPAAEAPMEPETPAEPAVEETEQEKQERLEAAQERITKENQRMLDEREEKLEVARKHSAELNARFADWYYEISESTFSKLHLSLDDLIQNEDEQPAPGAAGQPQFNGFPGGLPPGFPGGLQQ